MILRKVEREFAVRNVAKLVVDGGQQADKGRKTRLNDVDGLVRGVKSAGRIERRLLRNKRSFGELWNRKGECAIPCDEQLCSFPTLSEQDSSQMRQMDRGEIEVEEERRVRTKRMPVLPTDREKHENESAHATRSPCKTEDSRKHLENKSSLPPVAMDRGFLAHSTDADLVTNTMLIQKLHSVAEARLVSHETPESHAVNCVLENLDANGLARVLLRGDVGSTAQTLVDPAWVGRGDRIMAEKSSKCVHQSRGAGENDVRKIESSAKINDSVLPERFGCRANSKGVVAPWVAGCVARVLRRSEKHHNVRARSKMRKFRDVSTQGRWDSGSWK